jgi:flagellar basal-body rod modification protein FlgD
MDNLGVTGYGVLGQTYASATNSASSAAQSSDATLGMNDFLMLLAAQFQNQDVMNPTDNTEFISELAQFSALQAMSELTQYSQRQYASSLVGKTVVVGGYDQTGAYVTKQGVVQSATFSSDKCSIIVDDSAYDLSSVVQVVQNSSASQDSAGGDDAASA